MTDREFHTPDPSSEFHENTLAPEYLIPREDGMLPVRAADPSQEFHEQTSAPEYHAPLEDGVLSGRTAPAQYEARQQEQREERRQRRQKSAMLRGLAQATAVVMTAVVTVTAAPAITPPAAAPEAPVETAAPAPVETPPQTIPIPVRTDAPTVIFEPDPTEPPEPEPTELVIPEEYRKWLDGLLAICSIGSDDDVVGYLQTSTCVEVCSFIQSHTYDIPNRSDWNDVWYDGDTLTAEPGPVPSVSLYLYVESSGSGVPTGWHLSYARSGADLSGEGSDGRVLYLYNSENEGKTSFTRTSFTGVYSDAGPVSGDAFHQWGADDYLETHELSGSFSSESGTDSSKGRTVFYLENGTISRSSSYDGTTDVIGPLTAADGWLNYASNMQMVYDTIGSEEYVMIQFQLSPTHTSSWVTTDRGGLEASRYHTVLQEVNWW